MKITTDQLKDNLNNATELASAMESASYALAAASELSKNSGFVLSGISNELRILYDVIISLMLDAGIYEYTVDVKTLEDVKGYQYELEYPDDDSMDEQRAIFRVIFPPTASQDELEEE